MSIIGRSAILVASMIVFAVEVSASNPSRYPLGADWSPSIQVVPELRIDVAEMLQRSPTFRAQYRRIAESGSIVVGVHMDSRLCGSSFRARTTFRRYKSGLIVVDVSIGPGSKPAEWIAHEFEHILEQLDGRNLTALARANVKDVWFSGGNVIETGRAIRAGHAVREELTQSHASR
jgi:hypothetical protein